MKRIGSVILALGMLLALSACAAPVASSSGVSTPLRVGIIQLVEHDALDAAREGFMETLKEKNITVEFDVQNAQGEQSNCATIATKFVNDKVDLILAIATPAAQAAAQATKEIPILVTAVTDPAAVGIVQSNEKPGTNVSGSSDMNPIEQQVSLTKKLVPNATTVGIMYCSSEDNSILQAELAQAAYESAGYTVEVMTAADSNEVQSVTSTLCSKSDVIYIPTDNLYAAAMPTVAMVTGPAKIPVICGEGNMAMAGGLATYGLDYYNLGKMAAEQAFDILANGADISEMPIRYSAEEDLQLFINKDMAETIGIDIPEELAAEA